MNEDKGFSIRGKLLTEFSIILGLFILMLGIVFFNLYQNRLYSERVVSIYIPVEHQTIDLITAVGDLNRAYAKWLSSRDSASKSSIDALVNNVKLIEAKIDSKSASFNEAEAVSWNNIKSSIDQLISFRESLDKSILQNNTVNDDITKIWVSQILPLAEKITKLINNDVNEASAMGFVDMQSKLLSDGVNKLVESNKNLELYVIIMVIITILASVAIVYITANKITLPLNEAINAARKIAEGERKVTLKCTTKDETGQLISSLSQMQQAIRDGEESLRIKEKETRKLLDSVIGSAKRFSQHSSSVASGDLRERIKLNGEDNEMMAKLGNELNSMTDGLSTMTKQIMETSHNMVSTLEEVRRAVEVQSSGATEQAASINEITASLGEIEKSTSQTIDKARALGKAAKKTQEKGHLGLNSVEESVNGMKVVRDKVQLIAQTILDLSKQTQQVGEITGVVNNLAQQSKMLALNASIEAAKAGESGKGFAVVAAEVKNLAEQSEQSTTQVQKILEDIRHSTEKAVMVTEEGTKGVDHGMVLVEQAGEIIRNLNDVIYDATVASQQIEAAITQEGVGIEQITAGMNEINQVTTSLVQSVKQTTEAIGNLADISKKLKTSVDIYKV